MQSLGFCPRFTQPAAPHYQHAPKLLTLGPPIRVRAEWPIQSLGAPVLGHRVPLFSSLSYSHTGPCWALHLKDGQRSPSVTKWRIWSLFKKQSLTRDGFLLSPTQTSGSYRHRVAMGGARDRDEQSPELCLRYRCQVYRTN